MGTILRHPLPPGYSGGGPEPVRKKPDETDAPSLDDTLPLDLSEAPVPVSAGPARATDAPGTRIRSFEQKLGSARHEDKWVRTPNVTGVGAIHVKSFHCRLTGDSLEFLDQQINEWLDAHPQYEVKLVTSSVGMWSGKLKEPSLIVNVWV